MTRLLLAERPDWQGPEPRLVCAPEQANWDTGPEAVDLAAIAGLVLDRWQASTLTLWLATDPAGRWARFAAAIECVRQQGKGGILEARGLAGLFLLGERKIVYTAHLAKTVREIFERVVPLVENTPSLMARVATIYKSTNDRRIVLKDGATWEFFTRSDAAGRGMSGDCVMLDEAQELGESEVGDIVPTMLARNGLTVGGPQLIYAGSAGDDAAEKWAAVRDRAIADDQTLTYVGYSAGAADDHTGEHVDIDDEAEWAQANPALESGRVTMDGLRAMRAELGDAEFAREHLGLWHIGSMAAAVDLDAWHRCKDDDATAQPPPVFAVDIPPEGKSTTIVSATWAEDGQTIHWEVVDRREGTLWAVDRLAELQTKWDDAPVWLDPRSRAGKILADLTRADVAVDLITARDYIGAVEAANDRIDHGMIRHTGQDELTSACEGSRRRTVGKPDEGRWVWHRRDTSVDLSPLVASTIATHGLLVAEPPKPKPKPRKARAMFV